MKVTSLILLSACLFAFCRPIEEVNGPYLGNGVHNGWADQNSITIWTRLTQNPEMNQEGGEFIQLTKKQADKLAKSSDIDFLLKQQVPDGFSLDQMKGACPGAEGEVQLIYYEKGRPESKVALDWAAVDPNKNFTRQWKLTDLNPNTEYVIELTSRNGEGHPIADKLTGAFVTAPTADQREQVSFAVVSCHDYNRRDTAIGHKIYAAMERDHLDFFAHTGDIEYYDKVNPWAMTESMMYYKWDRLFALPLQREYYSNTTSYFMKDDHDALRNDAFPGSTYGPVTFERGLEIFDKEQFPSNDKTYKTIRWGKDLQIWILEGRNFRSKNTDEDGPGKTILGATQKQWLFTTLQESGATYKVIITSSPILGPDRPKGKNDNYSNKAFEYEGTEIRNFINQFDNVFICTGDRHWQYASHFEGTNLWEFGCGAGADEHAGGWSQDDVKPEHMFLRVKGGYLFGKIYQKNGNPKIRFEHRDVDGIVVHEETFGS